MPGYDEQDKSWLVFSTVKANFTRNTFNIDETGLQLNNKLKIELKIFFLFRNNFFFRYGPSLPNFTLNSSQSNLQSSTNFPPALCVRPAHHI